MTPDTLIQQIDTALGRLAVDAVVSNDGQALAALKTGLAALGDRLADAGLPGLDEVAASVRRTASLTAVDTDVMLMLVEDAWKDWKLGKTQTALADPPPAAVVLAAPAAPLSDARVEDDVLALRVDPELSGMFIAEALDHLGTIEAAVLDLEAAPGDVKLLNDIFRPFHTVKGNSGALGVRTVQELAHRVENLLDLGRSGKHHIGAVEIDVILKGVDLLTGMITDLGQRLQGRPGRDFEADRVRLIAVVDAVVKGGPAAPDALDLAPAAQAGSGVAAEPLARVAAPHRADDTTQAVKVDTRKLDNLVDMVGELVIVQSIIQADPRLRALDETLSRNLAQFRRITSDLQRTAMSMRMVPIRQTFQKMARLVRDLSKKSGKQVELVLSGEDTELDRKVVEDINDPLMHMVRNSMDHGIEDGAVRARAGKAGGGRLSLSAYHQGGNIIIAIADDGTGLNTEKIRAKAVAQGLIETSETRSAAEIHQLIFCPGFSTADKVTEISGRGVGMDVVRRNIEALRGRVEIQSLPGQGTTFVIKLPLTLAIVDGLLVRVGDQRFVLPTFSVRESLRPLEAQVHAVQGRPCLVQVRDSLIPLVRLADVFGIDAAVSDAWRGTVVVIEDDGTRVALLVDELLGKQEVVIKSLGDTFAHVRGVAGGAILGDGRIGLILDGNGIVSSLQKHGARAAAA